MFIFIWLLCGVVAAMIGARKGMKGPGFLFGILFGPIGILIVLFSAGNKKSCPFCKELMHKEATRCPHCQKELPLIQQKVVQEKMKNAQVKYHAAGQVLDKKISKRFWIVSLIFSVIFISVLFLIKSSLPPNSSSEVSKGEVKMLWDIPRLMNKSHNQIIQILGNPTVVEKFSDGKTERFKFVNGEMQRFFEQDVPARIGMKTVDYEISYKQSDCEMMICGNDLWYDYIDPDKPVKYFYISNYPVGNPSFSVAELKQVGNLSSDSTIRIIPSVFGKRVAGIDICEKNYQGDVNIEGSENCSK